MMADERDLRDVIGEAMRETQRPLDSRLWRAVPPEFREVWCEEGDFLRAVFASLGLEIIRREDGERP